MDPLSSFDTPLERISYVAKHNGPDQLNDGTARHIRSKVKVFVDQMQDILSVSTSLNDVDMVILDEKLEKISSQFSGVFTQSNEKEFPDLKTAHHMMNTFQLDLRMTRQLQSDLPQLLDLEQKVNHLIQSYEAIDEGRYLFFNPERGRFTSTKHPPEHSHEEVLQEALVWLSNKFETFNSVFKKEVPNMSSLEAIEVSRRLSGLQDKIQLLLNQLPQLKDSELPAVLRFANEAFIPSTFTTKLSEELEAASRSAIDGSEFELIESVKRVIVQADQFDPFIDTSDLRAFGNYLNEHMDEIQSHIMESDSSGGFKAFTIRKNDEIPRTLQVFLPDGGTFPKDLQFTIQLKNHGMQPLNQEALEKALDLIRAGKLDPTSMSAKELAVIGKGGFKTAKHSLTFPFEAIDPDGSIDPTFIHHTTTLTPHTQTKESVTRAVIQTELYQKPLEIRNYVQQVINDFEDESEMHELFKGRGVLPIIGHSIYTGHYSYENQSLFQSFFGGGETASLTLRKTNIVTPICDGDIIFSPKKAFTFEEKKSLALDILEGLMRIHEMGYQHGDIKPDNILYQRTKDGIHGYLSDFGLSRDENKYKMVADRLYLPPVNSSYLGYSPLQDQYAVGLTLLGLFTDSIFITQNVENENTFKFSLIESPILLRLLAYVLNMDYETLVMALGEYRKRIQFIYTLPAIRTGKYQSLQNGPADASDIQQELCHNFYNILNVPLNLFSYIPFSGMDLTTASKISSDEKRRELILKPLAELRETIEKLDNESQLTVLNHFKQWKLTETLGV